MLDLRPSARFCSPGQRERCGQRNILTRDRTFMGRDDASLTPLELNSALFARNSSREYRDRTDRQRMAAVSRAYFDARPHVYELETVVDDGITTRDWGEIR